MKVNLVDGRITMKVNYRIEISVDVPEFVVEEERTHWDSLVLKAVIDALDDYDAKGSRFFGVSHTSIKKCEIDYDAE